MYSAEAVVVPIDSLDSVFDLATLKSESGSMACKASGLCGGLFRSSSIFLSASVGSVVFTELLSVFLSVPAALVLSLLQAVKARVLMKRRVRSGFIFAGL